MEMKKYDACLSNRDCIFDSGVFESAEDVVAWAKGRGGKYVLQVSNSSDHDFPGCSISTDNGKAWSQYIIDRWVHLTESEVLDLIRGL